MQSDGMREIDQYLLALESTVMTTAAAAVAH